MKIKHPHLAKQKLVTQWGVLECDADGVCEASEEAAAALSVVGFQPVEPAKEPKPKAEKVKAEPKKYEPADKAPEVKPDPAPAVAAPAPAPAAPAKPKWERSK